MSRSVPDWLWAAESALGSRSAGAVLLLGLLASFADFDQLDGEAFIWPSVGELLARCGDLSERTVEDRLRTLEAAGVIERARRVVRDVEREGWVLHPPAVGPRSRDRRWRSRADATPDRATTPRPTVRRRHARPCDDATPDRATTPRPTVRLATPDRAEHHARPCDSPRPTVVQDLIRTGHDLAVTPRPRAVGMPPEVPRVGLPSAIARAVADHPQAGASIAMSDAWLADLAVLVPELQLAADDVVALLDAWFARAAELRERGQLDVALQRRELPQLRELWWRRSVPWLLEQLKAHRGRRAAPEGASVLVVPAVPLPDAQASDSDLAFLRGRRSGVDG